MKKLKKGQCRIRVWSISMLRKPAWEAVIYLHDGWVIQGDRRYMDRDACIRQAEKKAADLGLEVAE